MREITKTEVKENPDVVLTVEQFKHNCHNLALRIGLVNIKYHGFYTFVQNGKKYLVK